MPLPQRGRAGVASELVEYVKFRMPLRARVLGEEKLQDIVLITVAAWPIDGLVASQRGSSEERAAIARARDEVARTFAALHGEPRSSSVLLAILLPAILSAVIQVVLRWWLEKRSRRLKMAVWQIELRGRAR